MYKYKLKILHFFIICVYILVPIFVLLYSESSEEKRIALFMILIGLLIDFVIRNRDNEKVIDFLRNIF